MRLREKTIRVLMPGFWGFSPVFTATENRAKKVHARYPVIGCA